MARTNQKAQENGEPKTILVGADDHPAFQQIAFGDSETGELNQWQLGHREEAEKFYPALAAPGMKVRLGMEASGHARWFERLLAELHLEFEGLSRNTANPSVKKTRAADSRPG